MEHEVSSRHVAPKPVTASSYFSSITSTVSSVMKTLPGTTSATKAPVVDVPTKETVLWTKFDEAGTNTPGLPAHIKPYLLIGYTGGLHVWDIRHSENVNEVLSFRDSSPVLCAKVLTAPLKDEEDKLKEFRPLICIHQPSRKTIDLYQLTTVSTKKRINSYITVDSSPLRIESNHNVIVLVFENMLRLFSSSTLEYVHNFDSCRPCLQSHLILPIAIGTEWVAFPTSREPPPDAAHMLSDGLLDSASGGVRMETVVGMAQKTGSSLMTLSGLGVKSVSDLINGVHDPAPAAYRKGAHAPDDAAEGPAGIVAVAETTAPYRVIAHFRAHYKPVAALDFDPSGTMLATACEDGQSIHIFSLATAAYRGGSGSGSNGGSGTGSASGTVSVGSPRLGYDMRAAASGGSGVSIGSTSSATGVGSGITGSSGSGSGSNTAAGSERWRLAATHLYVLKRGVTTGIICCMTFSADARWIAITSNKGTIHFFPINRKGGAVGVRTHTSPTAINHSSFQTSSGILDITAGRSLPPVEVPSALAKLKFPVIPADHARASSGSIGGAAGAARESGVSGSSTLLGPGDHPLPGFAVACMFHYLEQVRESDPRISWASDPALPASTMTVLVCTPQGELVEHRLLPYGPGNKERAQDAIIAGGGKLPQSDAIITAVSSIAEGFYDIFNKSRAMLRQSPSVSPPVTAPSSVGSTSSGASGHGPDASHNSAVGLACAATRMWDVCRMSDWPTAESIRTRPSSAVDRRDAAASPNAAPKKAPQPLTQPRQPQQPQQPQQVKGGGGGGGGGGEVARSSSAAEEMAWLSNIEINTYSAVHRRIWMGPQFTFKTFALRGASSAPATLAVPGDQALSSTGGAGSAPPADLYFRQTGLRARNLDMDRSDPIPAMIASHHGDPLTMAPEVLHVGTPIQDAPIMPHMTESSFAELQSCFAEGGIATPSITSSAVSTRVTPTIEDHGVFVMEDEWSADLREALDAPPAVPAATKVSPKPSPTAAARGVPTVALTPSARLVTTAPPPPPSSAQPPVSVSVPARPAVAMPPEPVIEVEEPPLFVSAPASASKAKGDGKGGVPTEEGAGSAKQGKRSTDLKADTHGTDALCGSKGFVAAIDPIPDVKKPQEGSPAKDLLGNGKSAAAAAHMNGNGHHHDHANGNGSRHGNGNGHGGDAKHVAGESGLSGAPSLLPAGGSAVLDGELLGWPDADFDFPLDASAARSDNLDLFEFTAIPAPVPAPVPAPAPAPVPIPVASGKGSQSPGTGKKAGGSGKGSKATSPSPKASPKTSPDKALSSPLSASPSGLSMSSAPSSSSKKGKKLSGSPRASGEDNSPVVLSTPPSLLMKSPGNNGLVVALGEADAETTMHRVHSNVSLSGLGDALEEESLFSMDA